MLQGPKKKKRRSQKGLFLKLLYNIKYQTHKKPVGVVDMTQLIRVRDESGQQIKNSPSLLLGYKEIKRANNAAL